jgi:hypothetical protein
MTFVPVMEIWNLFVIWILELGISPNTETHKLQKSIRQVPNKSPAFGLGCT